MEAVRFGLIIFTYRKVVIDLVGFEVLVFFVGLTIGIGIGAMISEGDD